MTQDEADADLGIRYGLGDFSNGHATALYPEWVVPVCSPSHLDPDEGLTAPQSEALLHPLPDRQDGSFERKKLVWV